MLQRNAISCLLAFFTFFWVKAQSRFDYSAVQKVIRNYNKLPIRPTRTISFITDEGSNMNVDISPDGKMIVFDIAGEMFAMSADGGRAVQLTKGTPINQYPVWSPDGKNIAYISDASGKQQLHVVSIDGRALRIFFDEKQYFSAEPVWLPNGLSIGTTDPSNPIIFHLYGGRPDSLPKNLVGKTLINFSPDRKFLYYKGPTAEDSKIWGVYRLDRNSGQQTVLHRWDRANPISNTRVSPNGKWLIYFTGNSTTTMDSLMAYDLSNRTQKLLTKINLKYPGYLDQQHYSFSSDSRFLFLGYKGKIHRIEIETGTDRIIPFTAKLEVEMGTLDYNTFNVTHDSLRVRYIRSIGRSPDGKQLVFSALGRIYVMNFADRKPRVLANQQLGQYQPTYSPDGKKIAYVTWGDTVGGNLWMVPSTGGTPEKLSKVAGHYENPSWSPNGKSIVVGKGKSKLSGYNPGYGDIQIISLAGDTQTVVTNVSLLNRPSFSADSKAIFYNPWNSTYTAKTASPFEPSAQPILISKTLDQNGTQIIAKGVQGLLASFAQISLSPDGKYIAYMYNEGLFIHPIFDFTNYVILNQPYEFHTGIRFASGIDPRWENGGKTLSWCYGNKYCRINPGKIIAAALIKMQGKPKVLNNSSPINVDIKPDEIINIDLKVPSYYAKDEIALQNVRIITMKGSEVIENGTVLIKNGRISFVGKKNRAKIFADTKVLNLNGKTIIPGLIDLHSHMQEEAAEVFSQQSRTQLVNFAYGATTVRNPSGSFGLFGHRELLQSGKRIGPRLYSVGYAIRPDRYIIKNLEDARLIVRNFSIYGATYIKQYILPTRMQKQWLLIASREEGLNMTNEGGSAPLEDIAMLKDGSTGIEHRPEWGDIYKDMILLFSKSGTYLTPTLQVRSQNDEDAKFYFKEKYLVEKKENKFANFIPAVFNSLKTHNDTSKIKSELIYNSGIFAKIWKNGGQIALGSHGEDQGIGVHFELWALQMGGLSNLEALQAATIMGAKALGIQKDLGSIEVGKIADLIILNSNPLEDIHNSKDIKYLMKDGVLYEGDTLDEIWADEKQRPKWRL
jgi:Tol biopolymer transport system component